MTAEPHRSPSGFWPWLCAFLLFLGTWAALVIQGQAALQGVLGGRFAWLAELAGLLAMIVATWLTARIARRFGMPRRAVFAAIVPTVAALAIAIIATVAASLFTGHFVMPIESGGWLIAKVLALPISAFLAIESAPVPPFVKPQPRDSFNFGAFFAPALWSFAHSHLGWLVAAGVAGVTSAILGARLVGWAISMSSSVEALNASLGPVGEAAVFWLPIAAVALFLGLRANRLAPPAPDWESAVGAGLRERAWLAFGIAWFSSQLVPPELLAFSAEGRARSLGVIAVKLAALLVALALAWMRSRGATGEPTTSIPAPDPGACHTT